MVETKSASKDKPSTGFFLGEKKATRDGFGAAIAEIGANKKIVVLDADLSESTKSAKFKDKYPERFFNMGIAEQDMVGTAAGLAAISTSHSPSSAVRSGGSEVVIAPAVKSPTLWRLRPSTYSTTTLMRETNSADSSREWIRSSNTCKV